MARVFAGTERPAGLDLTAPGLGTQATAVRLRVAGVVQGVGFRPFVHRLATRHALSGWVRNVAGDVCIEAEGPQAAVGAFVQELRDQAPPLARVETVALQSIVPQGSRAFLILESGDDPTLHPPVSPDLALCAACEAELFNPASRRYRYPFITCTDCGPRFSVIQHMPYDRERTSMAVFPPCAACADEYHAPGHRRYRSESNSCPACGPDLWFLRPGEARQPMTREAALESAAAVLRAGHVLALRGLGGFHLAVDATDAAAVARLRQRKQREAKPLAIMVRTPADAEELASLDPLERRLLAGPERPIVLVRPRRSDALAAGVAPGLTRVGVMLAYTPLHHLLLDLVRRPLVMTSANLSDEPIVAHNEEAETRLHGIAEGFLLHDREIIARIDDSVVRVAAGQPILLRRARGHAPLPLRLPVRARRPLVAVGPHLKNTFTLAHDRFAVVSPHLGDLESLETMRHAAAMLARCRELFRIEPELVVRDLHPGYLSTRMADAMGIPVMAVQHHHAHIAAVMAEHGVTEPVVGLAFDGTGYGDDGRVWGAEILVADLTGYRRVGRQRYAPLPGGDLAARQPWRSALGYQSLASSETSAFAAAFEGVPESALATARRQIERQVNAPLASSMGRLFDAAAAVLGVRLVARYEGQAAMELEGLAEGHHAPPLPFPVQGSGVDMVLDPLPLLIALGERKRAGQDVAELAAAFHASVAATAAEAARRACEANSVCTVALGGGVFQNACLMTGLAARLEALGLRVLRPVALSPNDGGLSYGQAAIAAARDGAHRDVLTCEASRSRKGD